MNKRNFRKELEKQIEENPIGEPAYIWTKHLYPEEDPEINYDWVLELLDELDRERKENEALKDELQRVLREQRGLDEKEQMGEVLDTINPDRIVKREHWEGDE